TCHVFIAALGAQTGGNSGNSLIESTTRGPHFDLSASKNVSALLGKTAYLNCRVKNLANRTVRKDSVQQRLSNPPVFALKTHQEAIKRMKETRKWDIKTLSKKGRSRNLPNLNPFYWV
ncbi:unnamed protein product, partial [Acanthoscelides obtectus]